MFMILMAGVALLAGFLVTADSEKGRQAENAAKAWVALVDAGSFGKSLQEASPFLKTAIDEDKWGELLQTIREPLGESLSRRVRAATREKGLAGGPEVECLVVEFETAFENHGNAVETVVTRLERDGRWRVAGYCIQ